MQTGIGDNHHNTPWGWKQTKGQIKVWQGGGGREMTTNTERDGDNYHQRTQGGVKLGWGIETKGHQGGDGGNGE